MSIKSVARRAVAVTILLTCCTAAVADAGGIGTTIDGRYAAIGAISGSGELRVAIAGRGGIPVDGVGAVALNVTAADPSAASFLTAWPTGQPQPTASNVNFVAGQTVPNMVIVALGSGGQISIGNYAGDVNVIVDVLGWFPTGSAFQGVSPARLADSRVGYPTIDGQASGSGPIQADGVHAVTVAGRGGVPASGAGSVALNVTAINPSKPSFVTVWPSTVDKPTASNINVEAGQTVPNMVMVPLGPDGRINIGNYDGTVDYVVDVLGWFPAATGFVGVIPARVMDTRAGYPTLDGRFAGAGSLGPARVDLDVTGRGGVPASGVSAVALNVTATRPSSAGFLTVWPAGAGQPDASNLNFVAGQSVANMVIVAVGTNGRVSIGNYAGSVDVVVDVLGWFTADGSYRGMVPARFVDTRAVPSSPPSTPSPTTPAPSQPANPGDTKNCSNFETHAEAQAWFDKYFPYYGDVAHLDGNGDGVACELLR